MSSNDPVANTARYLKVPLSANTQTTTAKKITATYGVLYFACTFDRALGRFPSSDDANMTLGAPSMTPITRTNPSSRTLPGEGSAMVVVSAHRSPSLLVMDRMTASMSRL